MPLESPSDHEIVAEFVEIDPSGRYGRYKEVLGKGAFKKVYRAFDELEGIEVAWNQIKVSDFMRNPEELERLYSEVHLLKTLKHKNIIKFYNSWVDKKDEHINFITEVFTSGTLRMYRKKHKHVDLRALKKWSKQILEGLLYLHSHDPPVIHRDLKCDNIFVNGNQGEVKIGDLGLAAILCQARSAHSVIGTPEFMAPELYEEDYNELVDIYAFGMCLLELVTFEYPYIECANAAQIYKKVTSGIKPASLAKVKDPEVRSFIEKCISKVSDRLSAKDLLMDHFLLEDEDYENINKQPKANLHLDGETKKLDEAETPNNHVPDSARDFTLKGQLGDPNTMFLKLHMEDTTGHVRNIHFPFDIEADTSTAVAREMVEELDLTDQDVSPIAEMIDIEIRSCFPDWTLTEKSNDHKGNEVDPTSEPRYESPSPSTNKSDASPGFLSLERLPSGRRYWTDAPKSDCSPLKPIPSDVDENSEDQGSIDGDPTEKPEELLQDDDDNMRPNGTSDQSRVIEGPCSLKGDNDNVDIIVDKLEHILVEQQKELDELKKQHRLIISDILMKLPPETRQEVVSTCKVEILKACISDPNHKDSDHSTDKSENNPRQTKYMHISTEDRDRKQAAENHTPRQLFKHKFKTGIEYMARNMGIAVILRNDCVGS